VKSSYRTQRQVAKPGPQEMQTQLEELCRRKVSELFQTVLEVEVTQALERLRYERRADGGAGGYRDGYDRTRSIATNRGPITIERPRVRGVPFASEILPKHRRKLETVDRSLTDLWLDGLATRDFEDTLRAFLGADAPLSAATITRTNQVLCKEFDAWNRRRLDNVEIVFTWADGIYLGAGPDDERRIFLVVLGADRLGEKQLLAICESLSQSEAAWEELSAALAKRGLRAPALLVADGALGLWAASQKAWPGVAEQRCWLHKIRNAEEKLPTKLQPAIRKALTEIMYAEREPEARRKLELLAKSHERTYPKVASCLRDDVDRMFAYYRFPHACWIHLRSTNPIESIFSPIRNRTDAMKRLRTGKFAGAVLLALVNKLSKSWRRLRGYRDLYELANKPVVQKRAA